MSLLSLVKTRPVLSTVSALLALLALKKAYDTSKPLTRVDGKSKVVVISGCDSGFGRMLAKELLDRGFTVVAGFLTSNGMDGFRKEFEKPGVKGVLVCVSMDVTSDASVKAVQKVVEKVSPSCLENALVAVSPSFLSRSHPRVSGR
jgi:hypothetical protein